jgi:hypothetical protein
VREIPRNAAEPSAQLRRFAEGRQLFPGGDENLLGEILAAREFAAGTERERVHRRLMALDDFAKGQPVARAVQLDEAGIIECGIIERVIHASFRGPATAARDKKSPTSPLRRA